MWGNEAERASFRVENSGRRWSDGFLGPMRRSGDTLGMFVSGAAEIMKFRLPATGPRIIHRFLHRSLSQIITWEPSWDTCKMAAKPL